VTVKAVERISAGTGAACTLEAAWAAAENARTATSSARKPSKKMNSGDRVRTKLL
jgi:hypothetical protein